MDQKKQNDIFVATLNNPAATPSDFKNNKLDVENTGLLTRDQYKASNYVKDFFTGSDGKFDDQSFEMFYKQAANSFAALSNEKYMKDLEEVEYSPFNIMRPKEGKTYSVDVSFKKDFNPFKTEYGKTSLYSRDENSLSIRELAQRSKVYDPETNTWSEKSANDMGLFSKFLGDTLVYAQWDEEGVHVDPETGRTVKHKKGDWKFNEDGDVFIEKLGKREMYGKQIVNPTDMLTTDGSFANQFDFMDSDGRDKSIAGTIFKTAASVAPFLIPQVAVPYGAIRAGISLASVLPTFYKSLEGLIMGDTITPLNKTATIFENYMAKFNTDSYSDEAQGSFFNAEQMSGMVGMVFSQIYEQRAAASLSKYLMNTNKMEAEIAKKYGSTIQKIQQEAIQELGKGKLDPSDFAKIQKAVNAKVPELQSLYKKQSELSKSLSLSYMALTSTSDVYGDALEAGYNRRTAGFASIASASALYALMMNNAMGDWFLDKTTGYSLTSNRVAMQKALAPYLEEAQKTFKAVDVSTSVKRSKIAELMGKVKNKFEDILLTPSELGENLWKHSLVEAIEETSEEVVQDMVKGVVDTVSYLGLTKKEGSFGGWSNAFSAQGLERYLASFIGGAMGGALFEFNHSHLSKMFDPKNAVVDQKTREDLYKHIADGKGSEMIAYLEKNRNKFGNGYLSPVTETDGTPIAAERGRSQADVVTDSVIGMINKLESIFDTHGLKNTDDDIVRRAILDDLVMDKLDSLKQDGKAIGIEGMILDDYTKARDKVVEMQLKLEEAEANGTETKFIKKELKQNLDIVRDIEDGKNAGFYFDKMMVLLNPKMFEGFLSIDRNSYTQNTYKVEYNDLPKEGLGLTQERIDKEWGEMISNKSLVGHLNTVTTAYLEMEKTLNPALGEYINSGYSLERSQVYKDVIDLKDTINQFYTGQDGEKKQQTLNKFVQIGEHLKTLGVANKTPWDVYMANFTNDLISNNLIKKVDYQINPTTGKLEAVNKREFTADELSDPQLIEQVNSLFRQFPTDTFDPEFAINEVNNFYLSNANQVAQQIAQLEANPMKTPEEEALLIQLKQNTPSVFIENVDDNDAVSAVKIEKANKLEDLTENIESVLGIGDINHILMLLTIGKDLTEKISDDLPIAQKIQQLVDSTLLQYSAAQILGQDNVEEFLKDFEALSNLADEELAKGIDEFSTKYEDIINNSVEKFNSAIELQTNNDLKEYLTNRDNLNAEYDKKIRDARPDYFKLQNLALDFLLTHLENGLADEEIFIEVSKMIDETRSRIALSATNNSISDLNRVMEIMNDPNLMDVLEGARDDAEFIEETAYLSDIDEVDDKLRMFFRDMNAVTADSAIYVLANLKTKVNSALSSNKELERFDQLVAKKVPFKKNTLYNLLREFSVTLNTSSKISTIFDILENEERNLLQASSVSNFISDNIRNADIDQAIQILKLFKSTVAAMSVNEITYGDITGFVNTRQEFAKRNGVESEVGNLVNVTSDLGALANNDLERLINKLEFIKNLSEYNSGKTIQEQNIIGNKMTNIWIDNWKTIVTKLPVGLLPPDEFEKIINEDSSNDTKLLKIENLIYTSSKGKEKEVLGEIMKLFSNVNPHKTSKINRDVTASDLSDFDILTYIASVISVKSDDWQLLKQKALVNFNKVPFYTQELASRIVRGSTINPELFESILTTFYNDNLINTGFISYIIGGAGTGKTTAVFGLDLEQFTATNDKTSVWYTGPTDLQTENLGGALTSIVNPNLVDLHATSKLKLWERLGISELMQKISQEFDNWENGNGRDNVYILQENGMYKLNLKESDLPPIDFTMLPNLLMIDEVTHFSYAELAVLNMISKLSYNNPGATFMKVIAAGDTKQMGRTNQSINVNINYTLGIFTPELTTSIRSANNQMRANMDFFSGLVDTINSFFMGSTPEEGTAKTAEFVGSNRFKLEYFQNIDTLAGTIITDKLMPSQLESIKNAIAKDPTRKLGILTESGEASPEIAELISKSGINPENIKYFTVNNVQGSEIDYFIFDTKQVNRNFKEHNKIRALYTWISRSKQATIAIDSDDIFGQFNISNGEMGLSSYPFEMLTKDKIDEEKEKALDKSKELVPETTTLDNNFKWKTGSLPEEEVDENLPDPEKTIDDATFTSEDDGKFLPLPGTVIETENKQTTFEITNGMTAADFRLMAYSFYKNASVRVTEDDNNVTLTNNQFNSDSSIIKSDLLFGTNKTYNKSEFEMIEKQWLNLKSRLFGKIMDGETNIQFNSREFTKYLTEAFPSAASDLMNDVNVKVEPVITVTKYNSEYNAPYNKSLNDQSKHLKDGDLFINLSAKIILHTNEVHYITLATFPKLDTITEKALGKLNDSDKKGVSDFIQENYDKLRASVNTNGAIEVPLSNDSKLEYLTGTKLLRGKKGSSDEYPKTLLSDFGKRFKDAQISDLKLFPKFDKEFGNNYTTFKELVKKYYFEYKGSSISEDDMKALYKKLANKPYVIITTVTSSKNNLSKLVPVYGTTRNIDTMKDEVNSLLDKYSELTSTNKTLTVADFKELNLLNDMFLNRNQVLDLLIEWGKATTSSGGSLLDLLDTKIQLNNPLLGMKEYSLLDAVVRFGRTKTESKFDPREKLKVILESIRAEVKANPNASIKEIKNNLVKGSNYSKFLGPWADGFHFIFAAQRLADTKAESESKNILKTFGIINQGLSSEDVDKLLSEFDKFAELGKFADTLISNINKNKNFYYSVPISSNNGNLIVNSGLNTTDKSILSKLFIRTIVESPDVLIDYKMIPNSDEATPITYSEDVQEKEDNNQRVEQIKNNIRQTVPSLTESEVDTLVETLENLPENERSQFLLNLINEINEREAAEELRKQEAEEERKRLEELSRNEDSPIGQINKILTNFVNSSEHNIDDVQVDNMIKSTLLSWQVILNTDIDNEVFNEKKALIAEAIEAIYRMGDYDKDSIIFELESSDYLSEIGLPFEDLTSMSRGSRYVSILMGANDVINGNPVSDGVFLKTKDNKYISDSKLIEKLINLKTEILQIARDHNMC